MSSFSSLWQHGGSWLAPVPLSHAPNCCWVVDSIVTAKSYRIVGVKMVSFMLYEIHLSKKEN
jgi:hypothetical protein